MAEGETISNAGTPVPAPTQTISTEKPAQTADISPNPTAPVTGSTVEPAQTTNAAQKNEVQVPTHSEPIQTLWTVVQQHGYEEVWGVTLQDPNTHTPSQIILQKYLNANDGDLTKAKEQLTNTLNWRMKMKPLELIEKKFPKDKFTGLGYITSYSDSSVTTPDGKDVFTWNIYGNVKDIEKTFGDLDAFIEWRVALMEMAMKELNLSGATKPITADNDPYKIYQVHDYKGTSFFRSPPAVRVAAKKTVEVLAMAYPETLREKFFINVPAIMGFMYGVMKLFVAPKTIKKFHPMSNGSALALEFGDSKVKGLGQQLPKEYGGSRDQLSRIGKEPMIE